MYCPVCSEYENQAINEQQLDNVFPARAQDFFS